MPTRAEAAASFAQVAESYDRGRPHYPPEAVRLALDGLGLGPASSVLDLGAGTGRLTRRLVDAVGTVVAVEPLAELRARLTASVPEATVLEGTAQAIPLAAASVDAVLVGEAFHWFHDPAAIAEIRRVLRPGGGLGLLWNTSDWHHQGGTLARLSRLAGEHIDRRDPRTRYASFAWRASLERSGRFGGLAEARIDHVQRVTRDELLALVESFSAIASLDPARRRAVLDEARDVLAEELGPDATVEIRYATVVYWTRAS